MLTGRYALRNLLKSTVRDYKTKKVLFRIDYAQSAENDWKANETIVRGGDGGQPRVIFNDTKESTLKITSELFTLSALAMLNGSSVVSGAKNLYKQEILVVKEDTIATPTKLFVELTKTPVDWNGDGTVTEADIELYEYENGVQGDVVVASAVTTTTVGGNSVTHVELTGVTKGQTLDVYYQWKTDATAQNMKILADKFPKYVEIIGDSLFADEVAGDLVGGQVHFPKLKVQPNYKLNYNTTGNATQLDMTFEVLSKEIAGENVMCDLTLYEN